MSLQEPSLSSLRNNLLRTTLSGVLLILGTGCFGGGSAPAMNGVVSSSPTPLSTNSVSTSNPCLGSGYYSDSTSCQVATGKTCSLLVLSMSGVSYACYSLATGNTAPTATPTASPPVATPTPAPTTDTAACAANGGFWTSVPTVNNVYGCMYNGNVCSGIYTKMIAATFNASVCNAPSTSIVQSTKKNGSKLCHNDWDGVVFKWRCTDNDPGHVQGECTSHINSMNSNFFTVSTATYQGTYVFPSSSSTVQYPTGGSIPCYTKLYCEQNTTIGGWGNCTGAWGTACWPDFNAGWLQNVNSNEYTTLKSTVQSVYCGKN